MFISIHDKRMSYNLTYKILFNMYCSDIVQIIFNENHNYHNQL